MVSRVSIKQSLLHQFQWRLIVVFVVVCFVFTTFIVTLFNLQIIQGEYYHELSLNNVLTYERITAPRGVIYDRDGIVLVANESVYQLYMRKATLRNIIRNEDMFIRTADLLNIPPEELRERYETEFSAEILLRNNLSFEELAVLEEKRHLLPEFIVQRGFLRHYPHEEITGHITGHLSRITQNEYTQLREKGYTPHCWIGKTGVERQYEETLKGQDGEEIFLRRSGRSRESWQFIPARPGDKLFLTISLPLQKKAWEVLDERAGSIVVLDINTGDVLAMVSSPSFNPQNFVTQHFFRDNPGYLQRDDVGLLNKSIQGSYPPGSIFKLFTALSAFEEGIINSGTSYYCTGEYYYPGWRIPFVCERAHGHTTLTDAIKYSCNYYFYEASTRLGIQRMLEWSEKTGLGEKTMIDLPFEKSSLFPSPIWKSRTFMEGWVPANTLHLGIGQGYLLTTPLEMASFFALLANQGVEYQPRILKKYRTNDSEYQIIEPKLSRRVTASSETWRTLHEGMRRVVNERGGTAYGSRSANVEYSGKTGTAENPHGKPHAWFAGYAPSDEPEIAFVVMLENMGGGGMYAAPLARELVDFYISMEKEGSPSL